MAIKTESQARKAIAARSFKKLRTSWAAVKRIRPLRDLDYRRWIGQQPCLICYLEGYVSGLFFELIADGVEFKSQYSRAGLTFQTSPTEAAHVGEIGEGKGMRQKASDADLLPLCGIEHHREGPASMHKNPRSFFQIHGIDRRAMIARFREAYRLRSK